MTVSPFTDAGIKWIKVGIAVDDTGGGLRAAGADLFDSWQGMAASVMMERLDGYAQTIADCTDNATAAASACGSQAGVDDAFLAAPSPRDVDDAHTAYLRARESGNAMSILRARDAYEQMKAEYEHARQVHADGTAQTTFQPLEDTLPEDTPLPYNRPKTPMQDGGDGDGMDGDAGGDGVPMLPKDTPLPLTRSGHPSATDDTLTPVRPADPTTFGGHDFTPTHLSSDTAASMTPQPPMMPPMQMSPQAGGGAPVGMPGMPGAFPGIPGGAFGGGGRARSATEEKKRADGDIGFDNAAATVGAAGIGGLTAAGVAGAADVPPRTSTPSAPTHLSAAHAAPTTPTGGQPPAGGGAMGGGMMGSGGGVHGANSTAKKAPIVAVDQSAWRSGADTDAATDGGLVGKDKPHADDGRKAS